MKVKALVSFSGALTMYGGEVKECSDAVVLQDLFQAGYVVKVKDEVEQEATTKPKKGVKSSGNK
jgi:hypothetical protein